MFNVEQMKEMLTMQWELNSNTANGDEWIESETCHGKPICWLTAYQMELCELMDCFPWKHWKSGGEADIENAKIELVDVWHFVMSQALSSIHGENAETKPTKEELINTLAKHIADISKGYCEQIDKDIESSGVPTTPDVIKQVMFSSPKSIDELIVLFVAIARVFNLNHQFTADDIYELYVAKNALNLFRQEHGYADGTYKKLWNGLEDNTVLESIIKNLKEKNEFNSENLKSELKNIYDSLDEDVKKEEV